MKTTFTTLISALSVLSLTSAAPTADAAVASFKLKPAQGAPAEVASLGYVQWDKVVNGNLGWNTQPAGEVLLSYIENNGTQGKAVYSGDNTLVTYLRPTHGTPPYFVKVGNPESDAVPALVLYKEFSIQAVQGKNFYGYGGNFEGVWSACGASGAYTLYYGTTSPVPRTGCTAGFQLEVEYV